LTLIDRWIGIHIYVYMYIYIHICIYLCVRLRAAHDAASRGQRTGAGLHNLLYLNDMQINIYIDR